MFVTLLYTIVLPRGLNQVINVLCYTPYRHEVSICLREVTVLKTRYNMDETSRRGECSNNNTKSFILDWLCAELLGVTS